MHILTKLVCVLYSIIQFKRLKLGKECNDKMIDSHHDPFEDIAIC